LDWNWLAMEVHAGNIIKKRLMSLAVDKTPRISLSCRLVPVQYREYEYGLLRKKLKKRKEKENL